MRLRICKGDDLMQVEGRLILHYNRNAFRMQLRPLNKMKTIQNVKIIHTMFNSSAVKKKQIPFLYYKVGDVNK